MSEQTDQAFMYSIPELLEEKVKLSKIYVNYGVMEKETSFGIDMSIPEMRLSKTLKSRDLELLPGKIESVLHSWEKKYQRFLDTKEKEKKAASVEEMNAAASQAIESLGGILAHTLDVHDAVDWDLIKRRDAFRTKPESAIEDVQAVDFIRFNDHGRPIGFDKKSAPEKPTLEAVKSEHGLIGSMLRTGAVKEDYETRLNQWSADAETIIRENTQRQELYDRSLSNFEGMEQAFEKDKDRNNKALDNIKARYQAAEPKAVEEYCDLVLSSSSYPDYFPKNWLLEYRPDTRTAIIDYYLLSPNDLPNIESYKYDKDRDEVIENKLTEVTLADLYDRVVYQLCIRTVHELFEADVVNALDVIVFNGVVNIVNPATGQSETRIIISVSTEKQEFMAFDLSQVDTKATFEHLNGVAAGPSIEMKPITPILEIEKTNKRFL